MLVADRPAVRAVPLGSFGADLQGLDLRDPSPDDISAVRQALLDHQVLRIRDTDITDEEFERFGAQLGQLLPSPDFTRSRPVYLQNARMVTIISNVTEDGKPIGEHGDGELHWHTDLAFTDEPSALTMLLAREVPPAGGNTSFANMYAALDRLSPETREQIAKLKMKHQASHNAQGGRRPGYKDIETDDVREMPGPLHPIIRTHPQNGRKALYLGRRFGAYIPGLTLPKSEELVEELWSVATLPQNTWAQTWKVGDLVIWDNRCTMHRRDNFSGQGRRRMHRLTTRGERPV